jgi:hypothetical protein
MVTFERSTSGANNSRAASNNDADNTISDPRMSAKELSELLWSFEVSFMLCSPSLLVWGVQLVSRLMLSVTLRKK